MTMTEREEISRQLARGRSLRAISTALRGCARLALDGGDTYNAVSMNLLYYGHNLDVRKLARQIFIPFGINWACLLVLGEILFPAEPDRYAGNYRFALALLIATGLMAWLLRPREKTAGKSSALQPEPRSARAVVARRRRCALNILASVFVPPVILLAIIWIKLNVMSLFIFPMWELVVPLIVGFWFLVREFGLKALWFCGAYFFIMWWVLLYVGLAEAGSRGLYL
jgi:hypothetical protein